MIQFHGRGGNGAIAGVLGAARVLALAAGVLGLVGLVAAAAASPAATQVAGSGPPDTGPRDTLPVLPHPELVVRALRAPVPAVLLPYAVTVRRPAVAAPDAGLTLGDALRAVPGLQVQSRYNDAMGDRIVVRGFGARAQFGVRGVQVLVDGIPATMADGQTTLSHLDLSLLHRAEVLRGPAAAAHGNAAGGVLLLTTRPPPARGVFQEVGLATGGDGLLRVRSTTSGSGVRTGWLASLTRERRDGYRPHSGTERYQLTGRADAPVAGGFLRAVAHGVSYDADNPGSLTLVQYRDSPHQAQTYNVAQETGEEGRHGQLGLAWERAVGEMRLEAALYGLTRTVDNPIPPAIIDLARRAGGVRLLLGSDAAGAAPALAWAVGLDGAVQGDDRRNFENVQGERGALTLDQTERVTNVAVHGQARLPLLDPLGLFLGARYDRVTFSADDRYITADNPDDSGRRAMDAVSPTAGLRLELTPDVSVFGNVSTAFETPTTTELVNRPDGAGGFNPELEPQRTVSWEAGARAGMGGALRLHASAYHARVTDALAPFEVASAPGRQYFRNAGGATHRGLELLGELRTPRLDLLLAIDRTDAVFSTYSDDDGSYDGNAVPGIRPWAVDVVARGRPGGGAVLEVEYRATGAMAADDANEAEAPGYRLLGLRAAWRGARFMGLRTEPYAGIRNALDATYVASVVPNAFGGRFFEPGPGRSVYLGVALGVAAEEMPDA